EKTFYQSKLLKSMPVSYIGVINLRCSNLTYRTVAVIRLPATLHFAKKFMALYKQAYITKQGYALLLSDLQQEFIDCSCHYKTCKQAPSTAPAISKVHKGRGNCKHQMKGITVSTC
ncbi:hypothetical protein EI555_006028, partial [Monodon monoceros]